MGHTGLGNAALEGFSLGANLAGPNSIGLFLRGFMERANQLSLLQAKTGYELAGQKELERYKSEQAANTFREQVAAMGGDGGAGGGKLESVTFGPSGPSFTMKAPTALTEGERDDLLNTLSVIEEAEQLKTDIGQGKYKTGFLSPRFSRGNVGNVAMQTLGTPQEEVFKQRAFRFVDTYLRAQTGAQRGFREISWIAQSVPNPSLQFPDQFQQNLEGILEDAHGRLGRIHQILQANNRSVPEEVLARLQQPRVSSDDERAFLQGAYGP